MKVPFFDIKKLHEPIEEQLIAASQSVIRSGQFIMGKELELFETQFAEYSGVEYCMGVGNGLDALKLLLAAYDIGPGDEVIVPANTFIASWLAISSVGATIVPVEPLESTQNIDPSKLEAAISSKTTAIMPVHLYGQPAEMEAINTFAANHNLRVIADGAQSHGAKYKAKSVASMSDATAVSFYPGKNLGALGDGGAVLTNDPEIASKVRRLRNYGSSKKHLTDELGINSRLDELQAALLNVKLAYLDEWNEKRAHIADYYLQQLHGVKGLALPAPLSHVEPVWHQFVVHCDKRDELQSYLREQGIETMIHYPVPPHRQSCYRQHQWAPLPVTEKLAQKALSLPVSPTLEADEINYVVNCIKAFPG